MNCFKGYLTPEGDLLTLLGESDEDDEDEKEDEWDDENGYDDED